MNHTVCHYLAPNIDPVSLCWYLYSSHTHTCFFYLPGVTPKKLYFTHTQTWFILLYKNNRIGRQKDCSLHYEQHTASAKKPKPKKGRGGRYNILNTHSRRHVSTTTTSERISFKTGKWRKCESCWSYSCSKRCK